MNFRLIFCIGLGVFVAHMAVFMIYMRVTFNPPPLPPRPKKNFGLAEEIVPDAKTGGRIVNREFTVSTQLAPAGTYVGRPDQPVNE